jgi:hypothetical protein
MAKTLVCLVLVMPAIAYYEELSAQQIYASLIPFSRRLDAAAGCQTVAMPFKIQDGGVVLNASQADAAAINGACSADHGGMCHQGMLYKGFLMNGIPVTASLNDLLGSHVDARNISFLSWQYSMQAQAGFFVTELIKAKTHLS